MKKKGKIIEDNPEISPGKFFRVISVGITGGSSVGMLKDLLEQILVKCIL